MHIKQNKKQTFDASRLKIGIVVSRFNEDITEKLLESALSALSEYRVKEKNIKIVRVAGSVETPFALQKLAKSKKYHCLVALGAVIKGETDHYTYVCKMAQEGVLRVMLDYTIPVGFGILMTNTVAQAEARTGSGADAVTAVLELTKIKA
ncbi:MAG: 6,7-dimethyl-8-ribityllumazine synthase [Candidatus Taylorbacteria bacterium]|nr:6,7-dimethyl-8-ribityllumazine synthase [Candidatus Taylorbacteria bacterium]